MRFSPIILGVLLYAAAIAAKDDPDYNPSLNFRPTNVSLNDLYTWVGSYYNATAQLDFTPFGGVGASANSTEHCPAAFFNQTSSRNYTARLGLTEPGTYNSANDPVNAFLSLWPLDFNFTKVLADQSINLIPGLDFALYSSNPYYNGENGLNDNVLGAGESNFNWTLQNTSSPPYNLSSTITNLYLGYGSLTVDTESACDYSSTWTFDLISGTMDVMDVIDFNGTNITFPNPTVHLQFDGATANFSLQGYVEASPTEEAMAIPGQVRLTFLGVIDSYHSDILRNDTSTPSWLRTVGFNNNSANIGYTTTSGGSTRRSHIMGSVSLTAIVVSAIVAGDFIMRCLG